MIDAGTQVVGHAEPKGNRIRSRRVARCALSFWTSRRRVTVRRYAGHDFFEPQPPRTPPALIMLRFILHDWADSYAIQILRNMREIAGPGTRLMIIERLIPYACKTDDKSLSIPGAKDETNAPEPLLPNLGIVSLNGYLADVQVRGVRCRSLVYSDSTAVDAGGVQRAGAHDPAVR